MRSHKQNGCEGDGDKSQDQWQLAGVEPVTEIAHESFYESVKYIGHVDGRNTHEMQSVKQRRNLLREPISNVELRFQSACVSAMSQQRWVITGFLCHGPVFEKEVRKNRDNLKSFCQSGPFVSFAVFFPRGRCLPCRFYLQSSNSPYSTYCEQGKAHCSDDKGVR
jgi:hypothetical protein